ncbi:MAG: DUF3244 domain-containing protein [Alistipes sp.]|nr:DUF3244 domain-containing protein [Alistipes sp.]
MNAIKNFQWLVLTACLFVVGNIQVMAEGDETTTTTPTKIILGSDNPYPDDDNRNGCLVPFTAYYQNGTIYISTMGEFTALAVSVVNETTGQVWNSTTDISDGMGEISIAGGGAGGYTVEIVTEYNECFTGGFTR